MKLRAATSRGLRRELAALLIIQRPASPPSPWPLPQKVGPLLVNHGGFRSAVPIVSVAHSRCSTFLVIALIAAALGFGGIAGTSAGIAQILFFVFIVLFVVAMIARAVRGRPPM